MFSPLLVSPVVDSATDDLVITLVYDRHDVLSDLTVIVEVKKYSDGLADGASFAAATAVELAGPVSVDVYSGAMEDVVAEAGCQRREECFINVR